MSSDLSQGYLRDATRFELIKQQVMELPTPDIEAHVPELNRALAESLRQGSVGATELLVAAALAFRHGDAEAQRVLDDPIVRRDHFVLVLSAADAVHTDAAQRFVQHLATQLPVGPERDQTAELLAGW